MVHIQVKCSDKSWVERPEWEDFNNRWPGLLVILVMLLWSGSGVMAGMVIQCVCGAISGQSLPIITCNENKLLPDHQHSLAGTCSVFTTFIIRCLSFTQSSHKVQRLSGIRLPPKVFGVQPFPSFRHNGVPSDGAGLGIGEWRYNFAAAFLLVTRLT